MKEQTYAQTEHFDEAAGIARGSSCSNYQKHLEKDICSLVFNVLDASKTKGGVCYLMELIRRLVYCRGLEQMCTRESIINLALLAEFLDTLHKTFTETMLDMNQSRRAIIDSFQTHLQAADRLVFVEPQNAKKLSQSSLLMNLRTQTNSLEDIRSYPVIYIPFHHCLLTANELKSISLLQFLITNTVEKTLVRVLNEHASQLSEKKIDCSSNDPSRLVCILDFTHLSVLNVVKGYTIRVIAAVMEVIWAMAPTLFHAIVFHKISLAKEHLWRWLNLDNKLLETTDIRIFITHTFDQLDQLLKLQKYKTNLIPTMCSINANTTTNSTQPNTSFFFNRATLASDSFWQTLKTSDEKRSSLSHTKKVTWHQPSETVSSHFEPAITCQGLPSTRKFSRSLISLNNSLEEIPCSGNLVDKVDNAYSNLCNEFLIDHTKHTLQHLLRNAAIHVRYPSSEKIFESPSKIPNRFTQIPSIRHTANVFRHS
ncbi:uncharacterized protein LOC128883332 [Hylaeus volcanicus]|uniref:uncharacterized protein LOC128883332 n=1 Tax=Hylaeus volcanicus TaxID=313075 RepID=UPI0023B81F36|nr:uncharacterized protein LOC128883332 [Hylaeus volcanicus]